MKRSIALMLILMLTLATVACGNADTPKNNDQGASTPDTTDANKELTTEKEKKYNEADLLIGQGKYDEAIEILESLNGYKESTSLIEKCKYLKAMGLVNAGETEAAYSILNQIKDNADAADALERFDWKYANKTETDSLGRKTVYEYKYNDNGYPTESTYSNERYSENITYTYSYEFDSENRVKTKTVLDSMNNTETTVYYYDDAGKVIKNDFTSYGYTTTVEYKYNEKGWLIEEYSPSDFGATYKYNDKGDVIEEEIKYGYTTFYEYEYDSEGRISKKTYWTNVTEIAGADTEYCEYEYDKNGNVVKETRTEKADPSALRTAEYSGYTLFYMG